MSEARAIKIAVTALGGQGGGVLANWIVALGERSGYIAQSTSVPGVAQRTGATVYYVELFPLSAAQSDNKQPVLALMPVPGDVDIVIAAELMEAGRAIMRGFVTRNTTLIASSHRDYAIDEKINMGDGRQSVDGIIASAEKAAGRFIAADMADAAQESGAVISAVMFGALAGSGALPIDRLNFEETIRASGRAVESNLLGFAVGFEIAQATTGESVEQVSETAQKITPAPAVAPLLERLESMFPPELYYYGREGLKRVVDFQDIKYGDLYLDRLATVLEADVTANGGNKDHALTQAVVKHLALWMTYEDSIRVADLKTRASRFERFREDVRAEQKQIVDVYEYLHPRVEEVCDILPASIGQSILSGKTRKKILTALLGEGRRVPTTKLRGFLPLYFLSRLRFLRRGSYRFKLEQKRIDDWLSLILEVTKIDYAAAVEIAKLQRLIKGYGDTHERGLRSYSKIISRMEVVLRRASPAQDIARLSEAALKDEDGIALRSALERLERPGAAAA